MGAVAGLKREVDGEILVYASYELGQALIAHDLVDELRLVIFPVVLGAGRRLFGAPGAQGPAPRGVQTIGTAWSTSPIAAQADRGRQRGRVEVDVRRGDVLGQVLERCGCPG